MDIFREQTGRIVYEQKRTLENYTNEYSLNCGLCNDAHLICCKNNGVDIYYQAHRDKDGKYIRKSISNNTDAINTLARKEYLRVAISVIKNNIAVFDTASEKLNDVGIESLRPRMQKAYRGLPEECFFANTLGKVDGLSGDSEDRLRRHREWAREPYEKSNYNPEGRRFMTSAGFRVRSKSEQHIVEQLVNYGVPFRYEQVIHVNDRSYSADFTFRDSRGELFYWEHAGMMDTPSYVSRYYRKMDVFAGIGIVPWRNLIITYDIDGVINVPLIKSIIKDDVIPRL